MILRDRFVRKVNEARDVAGISKAELARRMGVSPQFVSQYLNEQNPTTPGLDIVERFAIALGLPDPSMLLDLSEIHQVAT